MAEDCIFCRIAAGRVPAELVNEDEHFLAFPDVRPHAPVHLLVIPREHVPTLYDAGMTQQRALARMLAIAGELARKEGATDGFRTIINTGRVGHQEVYHVHMHILGGPDPLGSMLPRKR